MPSKLAPTEAQRDRKATEANGVHQVPRVPAVQVVMPAPTVCPAETESLAAMVIAAKLATVVPLARTALTDDPEHPQLKA